MSFKAHTSWWAKFIIKRNKKGEIYQWTYWAPEWTTVSARSRETHSSANWNQLHRVQRERCQHRYLARGQRHRWRRSAADMTERLSLRPAPRPDPLVTSQLRHPCIPRLARPGPPAPRALTCLRYIGADRYAGAPVLWRPRLGENSVWLNSFYWS